MGEKMTTKEKLQYCKEHGISISYIANLTNLNPATLTKWLRNEKGLSIKNEQAIELTLNNFAQTLWAIVGDNNDRDL